MEPFQPEITQMRKSFLRYVLIMLLFFFSFSCYDVQAVSLSEALDCYISVTSFSPLGSFGLKWYGTNQTGYTNGNAAMVSPFYDYLGNSAIMQARVYGPGTVSFYYNCLYQETCESKLYFYINNVLQFTALSLDHAHNHGTVSFILPGFNNLLEWKATGRCATAVYVDNLIVPNNEYNNIGSLISLNEALDNQKMVFITSSTNADSPWIGQTREFIVGGSSARSGFINHGQSSWLQTTVSGPGRLSFYWKVSSETNCDELSFFIDDNYQTSISGSEPWKKISVIIPRGNHSLKWQYSKDSSGNDGFDCGWLDKVIFSPISIAPILPLLLD
jgi:hypothetical protein